MPPTPRRFSQVDVFTASALRGNPLAVVHEAEGLDTARMAAFANWTHLSETTFLLPPADARADYRVRIFTPAAELPFAGHPTLGSCHAWLAAGGVPKTPGRVVQECGVGLVSVRVDEHADGRHYAFAAPPLARSGAPDAATRERVIASLRVDAAAVRAMAWVQVGPAWIGVLLDSAERVLELKPDFAAMAGLDVGVVGPWPAGADCAFEVRAFVPDHGVVEDPVTGSLNAGLARWLIGAGLAPARYTAAQGTALGRAGRVQVQREGDTYWIGGAVAPVVSGSVVI
jgi:PhzF family phenazine biosynthesis protein